MPPLLQQFWEKINDWLSLNDQVKIEIEGSVGQGGVNKLTDLVKEYTCLSLCFKVFDFSFHCFDTTLKLYISQYFPIPKNKSVAISK